jgi:hypothetical protein
MSRYLETMVDPSTTWIWEWNEAALAFVAVAVAAAVVVVVDDDDDERCHRCYCFAGVEAICCCWIDVLRPPSLQVIVALGDAATLAPPK